MQLNFPSETYCVKNETWEVVSFTDNVSVLFSNKKKNHKKNQQKNSRIETDYHVLVLNRFNCVQIFRTLDAQIRTIFPISSFRFYF